MRNLKILRFLRINSEFLLGLIIPFIFAILCLKYSGNDFNLDTFIPIFAICFIPILILVFVKEYIKNKLNEENEKPPTLDCLFTVSDWKVDIKNKISENSRSIYLSVSNKNISLLLIWFIGWSTIQFENMNLFVTLLIFIMIKSLYDGLKYGDDQRIRREKLEDLEKKIRRRELKTSNEIHKEYIKCFHKDLPNFLQKVFRKNIETLNEDEYINGY